MLIDVPEDLLARLKDDAVSIRAPRERLGTKETHPLRWQEVEDNPNGWRVMGDLATDLEYLVSLGEKPDADSFQENA